MSILLNRLLEARKLTSKEQLSPAELTQYENWHKVLTNNLTIEDIEKSIKSEIQRLEDEWLSEDSKNPFNFLFHWKKEVEVKARLRNYKNILKLIANKEKEKETLIKYIKKLINNQN
jgi:hypothetical protein